MGLSGSGKTEFAKQLFNSLIDRKLRVDWYNADKLRHYYNDWDFTKDGRIRQAHRLSSLAHHSECDYVICDFIAPLLEMRNIFAADLIIWMDTVKSSKFTDTDVIFTVPINYDYRVTNYDESFIETLNLVIEELTV